MSSPLLDCLDALPTGYFNGRSQSRKERDPLLVSLGYAEWLRDADFPAVGMMYKEDDYLRRLLPRTLEEFATRKAVLLIDAPEMFKWHTYERALFAAGCIGPATDFRLCFFEGHTWNNRRSRAKLRSDVQSALIMSVPGDGSIGELAHRFLASVPAHLLNEADPHVLASFEITCPGPYGCNVGGVLEAKGLPVEPFRQTFQNMVARKMLA